MWYHAYSLKNKQRKLLPETEARLSGHVNINPYNSQNKKNIHIGHWKVIFLKEWTIQNQMKKVITEKIDIIKYIWEKLLYLCTRT